MQFSELIGQREQVNTLTAIIDTGRVSHAQMLNGLNGYGTLSLAVAYSQYLNCTDKQHFTEGHYKEGLRADSCGRCPSCIKYRGLVHPDLHFIFPNTTTEQVRSKSSSADFQKEFRELFIRSKGYFDLAQWYEALGVENKQGIINVRDAEDIFRIVSYKTYEASFKVIIIWMVEKLFYSAAPKLLKILEEPTEQTLFLLVSEETEKILPTILSRVQQIRVPRIAMNEVKERLLEEFNCTPKEAEQSALHAEGNWLSAVETLKKSDEQRFFSDNFVVWMRHLYTLRMVELSKWIDTIALMGREQQKAFLQYCLLLCRACFLQNFGLSTSSYLLAFSDEKFAQTFPSFINGSNIEAFENRINEAIYAIERNAYAKIVWMDLSLQLHQLLKKKN